MALLIFLFIFVTFLLTSLHLLSGNHRRRIRRLPPGPKGWPIIENLPQLGPKPHQTLHALSKTFGPILSLRLGAVDVIVASSAAAASQFLRTHDANFSSRPPNSGAKHVAYNHQDLVFAPYGARWRMLRRLCTLHLFSAKAMEDFRHIRVEEAAQLVRRIAEKGGEAVDIGGEVNTCVTNALARATVGRRVFGEKGAEEFKEMVVELLRLAGVFNIGDFVPGLAWLDLQGVVKKMKKLHRRFDEFFEGIIAEHREAEEKADSDGKRSDMLSILIGLNEEASGEGIKLTDKGIKALLLNLFVAGTDTTSSTVEWALAELIRHPNLLKQAQIELDSVVGSDRLVSESDLPNLPFLQAIVKETFRLHPSTPLSIPRIASKDCEIDGYLIPEGSTLLVNVWSIARDPFMWPDEPLAFRPERFLVGGLHEGVDLKGNDFELIPFGAGRRICVGLSLGLRMVQFLTATLIHAFDWGLVQGQMVENLDMEEAYGLGLRRAVPLVSKPTARLSPMAYTKNA
ncbi:flavonoid 3'-monooxygenase CYP75B3-like [Dendrobium catenatum]|uniref:Flavonoid 3'-monooxygenase n=1 Tax=Dendrobium catenatum TaxID=906689 RepID=A0A2I0VY18_9ASPA|nr:flavonoid 3'-monooxygenase CYP75B3-like [Dendrobium catenatum]PKU68301.1 Flavonoid 3'-monooxygenase [Dendrobium catenatum]